MASDQNLKVQIQEISSASDRAAGIVLAAEVDDALTSLLRAKFIDDKDTTHKLLKPTGPLGAFGTKADIAYLLGLVGTEDRDDLYLIAEVRNRFAHWAKPANFADREIAALTNKITLPTRLEEAEVYIESFGWKYGKRPFKGLDARFWFASSCVLHSALLLKVAEKLRA